jgi:hypothetical protein
LSGIACSFKTVNYVVVWLEDLFSPLFSFSSFCTKKRFQISHAAGEGKNAYIKKQRKID